jgi:membrane-bound metal-dependent hydrolase YbcI (DUF457 family)
MDPVSHAALGRTLFAAIASTPRSTRAPLVAAVLGSLSPDLDFVLMPFGWDIYLRAHEIFTHTVIGTLCCALATGAAVRLFARRSHYRPLVRAAWLGASSHVFLDVVSGARLRPGWPATDAVASLPLVAMADPWLLMLCLAGPVGLITARWWRSRGADRAQRAEPAAADKRVALASLAAIAVFLLVKGGLGFLAVSAYDSARTSSGEAIWTRAVEAQWASLHAWYVFDRRPTFLRSSRVTASGHVDEVLRWPLEPETAAVTASRSLPTVRNFLRIHDLGFAVSSAERDGRVRVLWSDIRFCWDPAEPDAPAMTSDLRAESGGGAIACALWFGGDFDAAGRPLRQVVKVGGLTQTRDPVR